MTVNEITFTNNEDNIKNIIIKPICYHLEIEKGETYIYKTKESDLSFEYHDNQITIFQNHELGFTIYKVSNNNKKLEFDMFDAGRIG